MKELEEKANSLSSFLKSVWGVALLSGTIIIGIITGFKQFETMVVQWKSEAISDASIAKITKEINPLSLTVYKTDRRKDSIQRIYAETIALEYMNRSDSIGLVLISEISKRSKLTSQLDRIEARLDADALDKLDDQLARIWKHLQEQQVKDSLRLDISKQMIEVREKNELKINNVKSGDQVK